ncbi:MAG: M15 family metallopeptidase, partial [Chitinophagales bacterium]
MPVSAPSVAYHHSLQTQSAPISSIEEKLTQYGLVNLSKIDDRIIADLKYASTDNFLDENVYGELQDIFMQKEVAEKLIKAQDILQDYDSSLYLIVHDAVRPLSIQQKMWDLVKNTEYQRYVASPYGGGGMHNYGCAVD